MTSPHPAQAGPAPRGLLVVGHGSRRPAANDVVREVAAGLAAGPDAGPWAAVEVAFLELAEPDIPTGFAALAAAGCREVVVHPFFLMPGSHTRSDIPALLEQAAATAPGVRWVLGEPLAGHPALLAAVRARVAEAAAALGPG